MLGLWAWFLVPLVDGWSTFPTDDLFFHIARKEIDTLHQSLVKPDSQSDGSNKVKEVAFLESGANSNGEHGQKESEKSRKAKLDYGKFQIDKIESSQKGSSGKENKSKKYGKENKKNHVNTSSGGKQAHKDVSHQGEMEDFFKDKLLYKSGNYEKGYHNKYHLDEILKHDKFWKNRQSSDKFHKYGESGSSFQKVERNKEKMSDQKGSQNEEEGGKKGDSGGENVFSEHKGHQSANGAHTHYEHKEQHQKHKP